MYHSLNDIDVVQYKNDSEHLLSANLTTREYVFVLQNAKINPAKITAFTVFYTSDFILKYDFLQKM